MARAKLQALLLILILTPVGSLGFLGSVGQGKIGLAFMFAVVTLGALGLGIWLWRTAPPLKKMTGPPPILSSRRPPTNT